jgi:hypothetical protein
MPTTWDLWERTKANGSKRIVTCKCGQRSLINFSDGSYASYWLASASDPIYWLASASDPIDSKGVSLKR